MGVIFDKNVIFSDKMSFFLEKTSNYQKNVDFCQKMTFGPPKVTFLSLFHDFLGDSC
jgi:hypothetical protein